MFRRAGILFKIKQFADGRSDPGLPGTEHAGRPDSIRHGIFSVRKPATGRVGGEWPMPTEDTERTSSPLRLVSIGKPGARRRSARDDAVLETFASQLLLIVAHPQLFDPLSLDRLRENARRMMRLRQDTADLLADLVRVFRTLRPAGILGELPSGAGTRVLLECLNARGKIASRARLAWIDRENILSPTGRPPQAIRLLSVARDHAREAYTVPQVAEALRLGLSTLRRLSCQWFGVPPSLIIELRRILSVANEIRITESAMKVIAGGHGFPGTSSMDRLFLRFVGMPPGAYRMRSRLLAVSENENTLSESD
jgi:AraC-like DNA-binding protein